MNNTIPHIKMPGCERVHQSPESQRFYAAQWQPPTTQSSPTSIPDIEFGVAPTAVPTLEPVAMLDAESLAYVVREIEQRYPL